MKPRITVLTISVDDLDRSLAFYRDGLGLPTRGIVGKFSGTATGQTPLPEEVDEGKGGARVVVDTE